MFSDDEDDYPDYFLDDDDDSPAPAQPAAAPNPAPAHSNPRLISFGEPDSAPAPEYPREPQVPQAPAPRRRGCLPGWFFGLALLTLTVLAVVAYFRYLTPVVDQATMTVNVLNVERRGVFFKTYEAEIADPAQLADTTGVYTHPRSVSVASPEVAELLRQARQASRPVELSYEIYSATLPWRGESKLLILDARPL